jgi:hypothetical protein
MRSPSRSLHPNTRQGFSLGPTPSGWALGAAASQARRHDPGLCQLWTCQSCTLWKVAVKVSTQKQHGPPLRELDASTGRPASQRLEVPLFGLARRFHIEPTLFACERHGDADSRPRGGLNPRQQRIQHTLHPPLCYALARTAWETHPSRDVPEGASFGLDHQLKIPCPKQKTTR